MPNASDDRVFGQEPAVAGETIARIGAGEVGGKASGLELARSRIVCGLDHDAFPGVEVYVPKFAVLTTEVFDAFVERNGLRGSDASTENDDRLARAFQRASLPAEHVGNLRALSAGMRGPLAVRASSLLEDAVGHAFAGVYRTKMIPDDPADADTRFRWLVGAVKLVYASAFTRDARRYQRSVAGGPARSEKMAVVVQEVAGRRHGERYYPTVSGVARSTGGDQSGLATNTAGVVHLALGLGKQISDGGQTSSFALPEAEAPSVPGDPRDMLRDTQRRFWAIRMGRPPFPDAACETEHLVRVGLDQAGQDGQLSRVGSMYDMSSDSLRPGTEGSGYPVLTFARLFSGEGAPLAAVIGRALALAENALDAAAELEFAVDLTARYGIGARLAILQVRRLTRRDEPVTVAASDLDAPDVLVASTRVLGNGERSDIRDIVYLKPEMFEARHSIAIAREVEAVNRAVTADDRPYLLIGFGRWGSPDPWTGVPVRWPQIDGARVIVEAALPGTGTGAGRGSHFDCNSMLFHVLRLSVPHGCSRGVDWSWLSRQPAQLETTFVRHVRLERALRVVVDGRGCRGVVRRKGQESA